MPSVADITSALDSLLSPELAADWDNVGLLLGDPRSDVRRILTCLTVTSDVAEEAVTLGARLIVTHHPILFRGVKRLTTETAEGRALLTLARAGVAVYSPHTAFDNARGGINDRLAGKLGLSDVRSLRSRDGPWTCKIVVFVPESDLPTVSDAMFAAGAGVIGEYRECSFRLAGIGTFFGGDAANPTVGQKGRREEVSEWRLEVVCPTSAMDTVVTAMRRAHSYEEPAFDVYPLRPGRSPLGEGRVGRLSNPTTLRMLAETLKMQLRCGPVQVVGELDRKVESVAIACGAAGEYLADAVRGRADVFVTGEMRFHDYLAAQAQGVALLLPGHYATERFAVEEIVDWLSGRWEAVEVSASRRETDPVSWV
ncbi:MAG TPA: Nif3-like dinuclear metal center hexameric protein [Gemmataceae bacterium]|nr:Nif3-like dinuclear metal center hexameric protein [Gemmataceae bacterium]